LSLQYKRLFLDEAGNSLLGGLIQTTAVGVMMKATGSVSRIIYGRNDPKDVEQSTVKREATLLGLTVPFTFVADWISAKHVLPTIEKQLQTSFVKNHQKLLMVPPALVGVIMAETIANMTCKRPDWSKELQEKADKVANKMDDVLPDAVGSRLNIRSGDDTQFRGGMVARTQQSMTSPVLYGSAIPLRSNGFQSNPFQAQMQRPGTPYAVTPAFGRQTRTTNSTSPFRV
jgi:hypothetical protein